LFVTGAVFFGWVENGDANGAVGEDYPKALALTVEGEREEEEERTYY
jgi:hypothetical protein